MRSFDAKALPLGGTLLALVTMFVLKVWVHEGGERGEGREGGGRGEAAPAQEGENLRLMPKERAPFSSRLSPSPETLQSAAHSLVAPSQLAPPPHGITQGADGLMVVSGMTRDFLDHFFFLSPDIPYSAAVATIRASLRGSLEEPLLTQAYELVDDYKTYLELSKELREESEGASLREILEARWALQDAQFREDNLVGLFGFDRRYDEFMVTKLEILEDSQLTKSEREQRIQQLEDELPEGVKSRKKAFTDYEAALASAPNESAAKRLNQLEQSRNQWQERVKSYQDAKDALLRSGTPEGQLTLALKQLRNQRFSSEEQRRLESLTLDP